MKDLILVLILCFLITKSQGQTFEGKIVYSVSYQHNKTHIRDSSLLIGLGTNEIFYIKNGDYFVTGNGLKKEWILYKSSTNKIYEKYLNNDTLFIIDAGVESEAILKKYHYRKSATISDKNNNTSNTNSIKYDEYVFILASSIEYFYFNKKYSIDYKMFTNYKSEHLGKFIMLSHSIPLIRNFTIGEYNCNKNAVEIIPQKIKDDFFEIPKKLITKIK